MSQVIRGALVAAALSGAVLIASASGAAIAGTSATPPPGAVPSATPAFGHRAPDRTPVLCKSREWEWLPSGIVAYNDVFDSRYSICIRVRPSGLRVTSVHTGRAFGAYPNVFVGCEYGVCSKPALPDRPIREFSRLTMTLHTRFSGGTGNDATDWWFDRTAPGRSLTHPDGAEVMVWLAWKHIPRRRGHRVRLDGQRWYVEHWTARGDGYRWQYVQVRWLGRHRHPSIRLNMLPIIRYCEHKGWVRPAWYPTALGAGFEIVHGGAGDSVLNYAVTFRTRSGAVTIGA